MRPILEGAVAGWSGSNEVRKAMNWALVTIDDLAARLTEAELLWQTAIDNEGTDWANDMKFLADEAAKGRP